MLRTKTTLKEWTCHEVINMLIAKRQNKQTKNLVFCLCYNDFKNITQLATKKDISTLLLIFNAC